MVPADLVWLGLLSAGLHKVVDLDFLGYYCIMHWEWLAAMSWLNWAWEFACEGVWVPRVGLAWMDGYGQVYRLS